MGESAHIFDGVRGLLFDLDDTLFDRDKAFKAWATSFVQAHCPTEKDIQAAEVLALLISLDGHGYTPRRSLFSQLQQVYPSLCPSIDQLVTVYYEQRDRGIEPGEGTISLLHTLREAQIPFGIVTNGSSQQQQKIVALGLDELTSCVFISEVFGAKKPDASIFLAAAACLQVAPEEILFVGDHPLNDIWGAHTVGMKTVWFQRYQD
ncbi:MAG TPA: HAD family hydrolase [Ktedonobacteraceae bacterium]|nr:HAD family hydrolase [Ktedonobacteraceae bacterium]